MSDPQRDALERALHHSKVFLGKLDQAPVLPTATLVELRSRFFVPLNKSPEAPAAVVDDLVRKSEGGILGTAGGRFYGWVIGAGLPGAVAADWLTTIWDQNAGLYACGPAAAVVEEVCGDWLKKLLGLPPKASFALVTGCQMAHVTCLMAARYEVLRRAGWDVGTDGLAGSPPIRVLISDAIHGTNKRALKFLGIGTAQITVLPTDASSRLHADALKQALEGGTGPVIVILNAGDVNCGVFDDFKSLIPVAHAAGAWVHVDGAMGMWANATPKLRSLLDGAELADSWATDGHKWLNVPYDSGYAFVADPAPHRASMEHRASYLVQSDEARDQLDWTPEHSRRARGFATWAALRELGRDGVADLVERCCTHAHAMVTRIGALPNARVISVPVINQGLVRFTDPKTGATDADHDRRTDEVAEAINASGEAYFTNTTWRGMRCMRVSVSSWRTTEKDVDRAVEAARKVLAR